MAYSIYFLLFVITLVHCYDGGLSIISPVELEISFMSASLDEVSKEYNITAQMVYAPDACNPQPQSFLDLVQQINESVIVLTSTTLFGDCVPHYTNKMFTDIRNVVGVVRISSSGSVGSGYTVVASVKDPDPTLVPMIEIANYPARFLVSALKRNEVVFGRLTTPTTNPYWDDIYGPGRAITVIFTIWGAATMLLAVYKLRLFILAVGFQPKTLPQMAMMLEIVASLMRVLAVADIGARYVFSAQAVLAFYFTHVFLVVTTSLITSFYWQNALRRAGASLFGCCQKMKIPAIIVFILWMLLYITCIGLLFNNLVLAFAIFSLLILTTQCVSVFYVYSGCKIVALIGGNNNIRASKRSPVSRMAKLIVMSGFSLIISLIAIILILTNLNQRTPALSQLLNQLVFTPVCVTSLTLTLVFIPPTSAGSDKSTSMSEGRNMGASVSHISLSSNPSTESVSAPDV